MKFSAELKRGTLVRRYKRFLADVILDDGPVTVHCPNTGSMTHCVVAGSPCWLSQSANRKRKYPHTWELATTVTGHLAGINSLRANALVREALERGVIEELGGYSELRAEVRAGTGNRMDFLLTYGSRQCFVEVKSVTYGLEGGQGLFPDAPSARARRHVDELIRLVSQGHRAVLLFCVQHNGIDRVSPADEIDATYGERLRAAQSAGVEVIAYRASVSPDELRVEAAVPVVL